MPQIVKEARQTSDPYSGHMHVTWLYLVNADTRSPIRRKLTTRDISQEPRTTEFSVPYRAYYVPAESEESTTPHLHSFRVPHYTQRANSPR